MESELKPTKCHVCGSDVFISIGDEGTGCYIPRHEQKPQLESLDEDKVRKIIVDNLIELRVHQADLDFPSSIYFKKGYSAKCQVDEMVKAICQKFGTPRLSLERIEEILRSNYPEHQCGYKVNDVAQAIFEAQGEK